MLFLIVVFVLLFVILTCAILGCFCKCTPASNMRITKTQYNINEAGTSTTYELLARAHKDACVSIVAGDSGMVVFGSGFVIDTLPDDRGDRYLVTAAHVVLNSDTNERLEDIFAIISNVNGIAGNNRRVQCRVVGVDISADVCVLRTVNIIFDSEQCTISIRKNDTILTPGTPCVVIGNPLGTDVSSLSVGIVRDGKYVDQGALESCYTTVPILPGNSGSPFVSHTGDVIGLVSWVKVYDNMVQPNFSGGVNHYLLRRVVDTIIATGADYENKGFLGITHVEPLCGYYMMLYPSLTEVNGYAAQLSTVRYRHAGRRYLTRHQRT